MTLTAATSETVAALSRATKEGSDKTGSSEFLNKQLETAAIINQLVAVSQIFGDKNSGFSNSSEYGVGANFYPTPSRNHRLNMQILSVDRSPVSSSFGYYVGGQKGTTYAMSFSVFF